MPGYEKRRIVGLTRQELDEFTCSICLGILTNPVMALCCLQTYCKDCISEWVLKNKNCPIDRKTLDIRGLKPVPRLLANLLSNMKIKCTFESDGCKQVGRIERLAQHLKICDYRPNQLCKTCGLIKESFLNHNCLQSLVTDKQKNLYKYEKLLAEKVSLLKTEREKEEIISDLKEELDQININNQNDTQGIRAENSKLNYFNNNLLAEKTSLLKTKREMDQTICALVKHIKSLRDEISKSLSVSKKYENLLAENASLLKAEREKGETLSALVKEQDQININHLNDIKSLRDEISKSLNVRKIREFIGRKCSTIKGRVRKG